ncbi:MAG: 4-hydroxy-tetrahydrodipicolinate synthase [Acidobacteriota bacterium]|nr:4-hydroxy-tetrahydrodipicolinate synthase [Acidobacteriota bacterium]
MAMKIDWLRGCATALVTPFKSDLSVDENCLRRLVEKQIEGGVKLLVPCGTTGESATMSEEERLNVIRITVEIARAKSAETRIENAETILEMTEELPLKEAKAEVGKMIPRVIAGTGSNNTSATVEFTQKARDLGANMALVVAPYYNKPTQEGLYQHFKTIADAVPDLPIMLYNVPGRTASNISAETTLRLARDCENIVATKEASGNLSQIMEILKNRPENFKVFSGDDAVTLPLIALSADGLVSVISNEFPDLTSEMTNAALDGDFAKAREIHYRILPLMEANFIESSPAPAKFVMSEMGLLEENLRLPIVPVMEKSREILRNILREIQV